MLVGVQFGTAIRNVFHVELVNFIMFLSAILISNFKNVINFHYPSWNRNYFLLLILQILFIVGFFTSPFVKIDLLFFHLYIITMIFALSSCSNRETTDNFKFILFGICTFILLSIAYQVTIGFSGIFGSSAILQDNGEVELNEGGDKITLGRALLLVNLACIVYFRESRLIRYLSFLIIPLSFICLFTFSSRSPMAITVLALFVFLLFKSNQRKKGILNVNTLFIFIILFLAYIFIPYLKEEVDRFSESILIGVLTLFGDNSMGVDASTVYRNDMVNQMLSRYNAEFNLFVLLFGNGYYSYYIDIPVIQAFTDMGIFVFFLYVIIMVLLPIRYIVKKCTNSTVILIQLFAMQYLLDQFVCESPYNFFQYMPLMLLMHFQKKK